MHTNTLKKGEKMNNKKYNKKAHHNSQAWYKAILEDYISKHGDLPSKKGPGTAVSLLLDK